MNVYRYIWKPYNTICAKKFFYIRIDDIVISCHIYMVIEFEGEYVRHLNSKKNIIKKRRS